MSSRVFAIIYIHSERGENNFIRGYCQAIKRLLRRDPILRSMCHMVMGDNPSVRGWVRHNSSRVIAKIPGFIIRFPKCFSRDLPPRPIVLDIGFANQVFRIAYLVYSFLERRGELPAISDKRVPQIDVDLPRDLDSLNEICSVASILHGVGAVTIA